MQVKNIKCLTVLEALASIKRSSSVLVPYANLLPQAPWFRSLPSNSRYYFARPQRQTRLFSRSLLLLYLYPPANPPWRIPPLRTQLLAAYPLPHWLYASLPSFLPCRALLLAVLALLLNAPYPQTLQHSYRLHRLDLVPKDESSMQMYTSAALYSRLSSPDGVQG